MPANPRLVDGVEAGQGVLGDLHLAGLLLGAVDEEVPLRLVVVLGPLLGGADTRLRPRTLGAEALGQAIALGRVAVVGGVLLLAGPLAGGGTVAPPAGGLDGSAGLLLEFARAGGRPGR